MHFRMRGNNVQIVKAVTDLQTQKTVSKPIGSANLLTGEIGERARAAMTPAEIKEAEAWIARQQALEAKKREVEFETLPTTLAALGEWVRSADEKIVAQYADEIFEEMKRFRSQVTQRLPRKAA